ncbi:MAG TPA: hypothetical protein VKA46_05770 [Gemmataceae bacterium]|nr:hypothetical protein [Gemmataceae bacterium]
MLTGFLTATARGADNDALRYKFKEGEKLSYVTESKTTVEVDLGGDSVKPETTLVLDMTWEITKVDKDGRATVTSTLGRVRFSTDTPDGKKSYDTKEGKEPDDEFLKLLVRPLKDLVGGQVTFTVDSRGQVDNVKPSEAVEKVVKSRPFLSADIVRLLAESPLTFPKDAPKKGDSWTQKAENTTPVGKMTFEMKYTCEGPAERGGRKVEKTSIKLSGTADPKTPGGAKVEFKGGEGVAYFDRAAGRFLEVTATQKLDTEQKIGKTTVTKKFIITMTTKLAEKEKP